MMTNVATMGPPPSPKEPRRSGRRTAPSSSKSPAGSPPSEAIPKPKDNVSKPSLNPPHANGRNKRAKHEDIDEPLEELPKNGVNGNGGASRSKRKGKEKEKMALVLQIPHDENAGNVELVGEDAGEFMAQCEECKAWQHGVCMGYAETELVPQHYFCEQCRPEMWTDLIEQWAAKRARQSSARSHPPTTPSVAHPSRNSRSHSPAVLKAPKRRNTMNSRDAAYEESLLALLESTKTEATHVELPPRTPVSAVSVNGSLNGQGHPDQEGETVTAQKRKRKRSDDDAASTKRTRSASITSDRPPPSALARDTTPQSATKVSAPPPPPPPPTTGSVRTANARNKRNATRKAQAQDLASVDGDEAGSGAPNRRQASNNRGRANNASEHTTRRGQGNNGGTSAGNSAASRAYHNSHAYVVSQQPLFTSWNLPDYLAHLEPMLPTDVPRPLEVRGSVLDSSSRESQERTTERGVKVKWPSKRMSVGDMNKRVRSLVEWVGREQAAAMERMRRKEALEKALHESRAHESAALDAGAEGIDLDAAASENTAPRERAAPPPETAITHVAVGGGTEDSTMKMMEELMEELIRFQERFGPGAKAKERDRRAGTL
ncbi:hypothetical protein BD413DRAFT_531981 [Trametes elegans]|nr:hypothetical protein BD413DRAFT_531981 [Trametes elegans]